MRRLRDKPLASVLIVDDHPVVLQGLVSWLAGEPHIEIAGTAASGRECMLLVKEKDPDAVILDAHLPDICGIDLAKDLKKIAPHLKVILIAGQPESGFYINNILAAVLSKGCSSREIIRTVYAVLNMEPPSREEWACHLNVLTPREAEIMNLVMRGLQNKEIADCLRIKIRTVEFHIGNILDKLEVSTRTEAVTRWLKLMSRPGL